MFPKNPIPLIQKCSYMAKQVMDIHAGKGMTTSQSNEHLRNAEEGERLKKWSGNYDPTREHLNFEIRPGGVVVNVDKNISIPKRIKEILAKRGITDPNKKLVEQGLKASRRTVANIILGGSREQMHRLAFGEQQVNLEHGADNSAIKRMPEIENWAKDMYNFMSGKFGEKNIAAFVVHLDETNPHIHCTVLPITEQNKFSWNFYFGAHKQDGVRIYNELHNELSEINAKYGLLRGDKISETGAKHRTTEQYHREVRKRLLEENQKLLAVNDQLDEAIDGKKKTIESLDKEIKHARATVKGLSTMISNLETYKADLEKEVRKLVADRDSGKISAEEAARKMDAVAKKLQDVNDKILDKEVKLQLAQEKLDSLKAKTEETENRFQNVKGKLDEVQPEYAKKVLQDMQAIGYNMAAVDAINRIGKYNELKEGLTATEVNYLDKKNSVLLDDSILTQMAEGGANITVVATNLFLGYLDKATAIAESHGGGGGPGTGWGKKDDEDELSFKRRCMLMAMHMMRPQNKVRRKR